MALRAYISSGWQVKTSILVPGYWVLMVRKEEIPLISGRSISITSTSGIVFFKNLKRSVPLVTQPIILRSSFSFNREVIPSLVMGWWSAIKIELIELVYTKNVR